MGIFYTFGGGGGGLCMRPANVHNIKDKIFFPLLYRPIYDFVRDCAKSAELHLSGCLLGKRTNFHKSQVSKAEEEEK